ncbi:helicase-related protein [Telmatospirillum sp.]|uniref:helicase-related protein n=1 Tax=Telmatospirillum sp. TaxID=2079197 RepID=UPI002850D3BA|nr:helicase-related protein [Telmatospirillum sp.]MDR3436479.1 helicase-related protein [Telmatospirillum sp.]
MAEEFTPRPDQIATLAKLMQTPRYIDRSEPGTGKTLPACLYTWWNWTRQGKKTVWLQPLGIVGKNRQELLRFTDFKPDEVVIFKGPPPAVKTVNLLTDLKTKPVYQVVDKDKKRFFVVDGVRTFPVSSEMINDLWEGRCLSVTPADGTLRQKSSKPQIIGRVEITPRGEEFLNQGTLQQQLRLNAKVILMGADAFADHQGWLLKHNPDIDLIIGDEWHTMFAGNASARTQALYAALQHVARLEIMTGTLVKGKLSSAYPAIAMIEPRYYGCYESFMNYHAILDGHNKPIGWINIPKFQAILSRHSTLIKFKDVYGDVPVVFQTEYVDLAGAQLAAYKEFEDKAILELEDMFLTGANEGVNLIRARQILSCPEIFKIGRGETTARDERLSVHLEDHKATGEPFVIFTASMPEQERILKMCSDMGFRVGLMNGNTSTARRVKNDEDFRAGRLDGLVCSPQVAAFGYNWGHVDHFIYLHMTYGEDDFEQSWKRGTRGVRTRPLLVTLITYDDTVEEAVLGVIVKKMHLAKEIDPHKQVINLHGRKPKFDKLEPLLNMAGGETNG